MQLQRDVIYTHFYVTEEELRDWVGNGEPAESRSTLNKDHVFLHVNFVLQQINFKLKQHNSGMSNFKLNSHIFHSLLNTINCSETGLRWKRAVYSSIAIKEELLV